jgi:hypothetical protein
VGRVPRRHLVGVNARLRCIRCDEPGEGDTCACGGTLGAGFALELNRDGAPQPPDDRDVRGTLTGRIGLRLPPGRDAGVVTVTLYGRARAGQAEQDVVLYEREATLHTGALKPHTIWPFELSIPTGPPSFDGPLVRVEWRLRANWTPPDGANRAWGWSLNHLPSAAEASTSLRHRFPGVGSLPESLRPISVFLRSTGAERPLRVRNPSFVLGIPSATHRFAWWAARADDTFAVLSKVAVVAAWAAAPIASALYQQRWLILLVPICAYFGWLGLPWARHHGPMLAAGARGWAVPRPRFPRAMYIGETTTITADPRVDWQLLRIEESASRRHGMVGSTPGIRTEWATNETVVGQGEGSGTLVHPADQPPSVTTRTRRIRWEIRAHLRGDPTGYQPFYLEILPTTRPGC